jgi:hypothetical protein
VKLPQRRRDRPDPLAQVRQVTADLEQLLVGVESQLDGLANDLGSFVAGVNDTAAQLMGLAEAAVRNTREIPDA